MKRFQTFQPPCIICEVTENFQKKYSHITFEKTFSPQVHKIREIDDSHWIKSSESHPRELVTCPKQSMMLFPQKGYKTILKVRRKCT